MTKEEAITKLDKFIKVQRHDTPYYRGLINGLIFAKSLLTDEEPVYLGPTLFDKADDS